MSELDEQKASRRLWIFAGIFALALHVGGAALAISHLRDVEADEDSIGDTGIEVGYETAGDRREETDLPPGPDSSASVASPQLAEQKAEVKETDLPQDTPTEASEADRQVTPNEQKKKPDEEQKVVQPPQNASDARPDSQDTASRQKKARRQRAEWQKQLVGHLDRHKKYPSERSQKAAEISVRFTLDRLGHVLSVDIEKGSGDAAFDEAALAMVRRSDPVPVPPPLVADEGLSFTVPVIFRVKGKS